jgi:hypothetical protein
VGRKLEGGTVLGDKLWEASLLKNETKENRRVICLLFSGDENGS